jgi:hypothetical protein
MNIPPHNKKYIEKGEKETANYTSLLVMLSSRAKKHKLE